MGAGCGAEATGVGEGAGDASVLSAAFLLQAIVNAASAHRRAALIQLRVIAMEI